MKIIVTGGTGFLGRHITWRLAEDGCTVVFTGRSEKAAKEVIDHAPAPVKWQPINHGSRQAMNQLSACAEGAEIIIHCAALSSPWGQLSDFQNANIASTAEVIAACRSTGVPRLVHISTPSLYFDFRDRLSISEDTPLPPPVNAYARTKAEAERLVRDAQLPEAVILRPRALFGPWDSTLMPRLLRVMRSGPIPLIRGGCAMLDLTYIENAVDAVWLAATKPLSQPVSCYNISNGAPIELVTLLHEIAREFELPLRTRHVPWPLIDIVTRVLEASARFSNGSEPILTRYGAGVLGFSQTLDISAIRSDLGYEPRVSITDGIRRSAQWWKAQNLQELI